MYLNLTISDSGKKENLFGSKLFKKLPLFCRGEDSFLITLISDFLLGLKVMDLYLI